MFQPNRMIIAALVCSALVGCGGSSEQAGISTPLESAPPAPPAVISPAPLPVPAVPDAPASVAADAAPVVPPVIVVVPEPAPPAVVATPPVVVATPPAPVVVAPAPVAAAPAPTPAPPAATANLPIAATAAAGFTTLRLRQVTTEPRPSPSDDGVGAFRNPCNYSHMAFDDPIVFPGRPGASHLHTFFGNTSADAFSTTELLMAVASSTCAGGIANLSSYWVPSMIDTATNKALVPFENLIYYKSGYNQIPLASLRAPPRGLRFVAGNSASNSRPVDEWVQSAEFYCNSEYSSRSQSIPPCPVGGYILSKLTYPNCWDGVNLDSPDHRSHMAYSHGGTCPASHPVAIPEVALNIKYAVTAGQDVAKWRLSSDNYSGPGGYSMHGDLWFNWQPDIAEAWMTNCVKAPMDCHGFLLGDGRITY